jgi:hypothetical protein
MEGASVDSDELAALGRSARWTRVREKAMQGRPAVNWDTLLSGQKVGASGWLSGLRKRLLGAPSPAKGNGKRRASFRSAFFFADTRKGPAADDADSFKSQTVQPFAASEDDPLGASTDHLVKGAAKSAPGDMQVEDVQPLDPAPAPAPASAAKPAGGEASAEAQKKGWRGSKQFDVIEGVFETADAIRERRALRRLPDVQAAVRKLWDVAHKWQNRIECAAYFDFHLSIFNYIIEQEEGCVPEAVDNFDAWDSALEDFTSDTTDSLKVYKVRSLHFDAFADAVFELIDLYTPTTKAEQYIGYIKALHKSIVRKHNWRHTWPVAPGDEAAVRLRDFVLMRLRAQIGCADGEGTRAAHEAALADLHKAWCRAERECVPRARARDCVPAHSGGGDHARPSHAYALHVYATTTWATPGVTEAELVVRACWCFSASARVRDEAAEGGSTGERKPAPKVREVSYRYFGPAMRTMLRSDEMGPADGALCRPAAARGRIATLCHAAAVAVPLFAVAVTLSRSC